MLHTAVAMPSQSVLPAHAAVLDVYSHNVSVTNFGPDVRRLLVEFCRRQALMGPVRVGPGRYEQEMKKIFAEYTRTRDEFRFHRNQLNELVSFLSYYGVKKDRLKLVEHENFDPEEIDFPMKIPHAPRPEQVPQIEYAVAPCKEGYAPSKVVMLQTGKGKTFVSFQVMAKIRRRTMIIIPAKFIAMWTKEVEKAFGFKGKQVWCIRGSADFKAMINVAKEGGEVPPVIIVSSATYTNFLDAYKDQMIPEYGGYGCHPNDLFKTLKVGFRLIDEVHMDFHRNFRIDLYTHIPYTLSLSATLEADNKFINTRYRIVWPPETHPPEFEYDCFIDVLSIMYSLKRPELIRCKGFAKMYSHVKFEESILKHKFLLEAYVDMIIDLVERMYIDDRLPGQKMFVICSTVNMCTILSQKLQLDHPELRVERYVSEDDYEKNCLTPDIVVTTIGSGGTGVDVPNLRETLNTVALDSRQASQQALGRTRRLIDFPDVHPRYSMLYAREIDKHVQYCRAKDDKFRGKVRSMRITETHYKV